MVSGPVQNGPAGHLSLDELAGLEAYHFKVLGGSLLRVVPPTPVVAIAKAKTTISVFQYDQAYQRYIGSFGPLTMCLMANPGST